MSQTPAFPKYKDTIDIRDVLQLGVFQYVNDRSDNLGETCLIGVHYRLGNSGSIRFSIALVAIL